MINTIMMSRNKSKRKTISKTGMLKTLHRLKTARNQNISKMNAVIYARVSSTGDRQSTERQVIDLTEYAGKNNMTIVQTFEEHISGARKNRERLVLNECLAYSVKNEVDIILISELSRLGRNVDEVLANIRFCKDNHLNIYFQKEGISIFDTAGKENPYLTIMIAVLATAASLERDAIYFRLSSGRKAYVNRSIKETGKTGLGRKVGYRKSVGAYVEEYKEVVKFLRKGYPIRQTAKLTGVSESTVKKVKSMFAL